jgi:adenine-specific DNA methylase
MSSDTRLIERWLPIAELGEESIRERRSMTALPPTYYLHVWWARRPLVASRAAILASLLPGNADHQRFLDVLGIHGDPVETRRRIDRAKRTGEDLGLDPYGYRRAFQYSPDEEDRNWLRSAGVGANSTLLDPTAGGGSIPFEATRLGIIAEANDLNSVAGLLLNATVVYPSKFGPQLHSEFKRLVREFIRNAGAKYEGVFPAESDDVVISGYLWARSISCPYCDGMVPLSPNWRLSPEGIGIRLLPQKSGGPGHAGRHCEFEVVSHSKDHSEGTVAGGDATCPFDDCGRVIDGDEVKRQAQDGRMGDQLYCVVYKRRVWTKTKSGKKKQKWIREYRASRAEDDNHSAISQRLSEKMAEWETLDIVPFEAIPDGLKTSEPIRYGMKFWRDLFSPRQLLCHGSSVGTYRELLESEGTNEKLTDLTRAAFVYLALALDKLTDYNSRMTRWHSGREVMVNTFDRHDFSFKWSYAEMAPLVVGKGYEWVFGQVAKSIGELIELRHGIKPTPDSANAELEFETASLVLPDSGVSVHCKPGDALDHLTDASVDVVVMDPPYYDNVMYAELSDFFYVWLKRTAGRVVPELFRTSLTDKDHEAVANPAKFKGQKGADALAKRDYKERMAAIFAECRRVLKPNGIMTLMFTHKATGAWDALTKGLMQAAFTITASWPINTEAEGSLHIKDKAAANSTIFLVCRPRENRAADGAGSYWEDVEPQVAGAVRERIKEFQDAGISGVDLYLACFGPALQKFSEHWPLRRGTPRPQPEAKKRRKQAEMFEEPWDPYEVTPEDALDAARREVKHWRLQQLTHMKARTDLDPLTSFYVLAWDAFRAPKFDYDEALRLARAVGVDLERDIIGHVAEKKSSEIILWDSAKRAAKGAIGPADGSRSWLDAVHHAAYAARSRNLQHAQEMLNKAQVDGDPAFFAALEAVLEVLPVSKAFSGIDLEGDVAEFGSDFEALENLRKLAFAADVDEPQQLQLWKEETEAVEAKQ